MVHNVVLLIVLGNSDISKENKNKKKTKEKTLVFIQ